MLRWSAIAAARASKPRSPRQLTWKLSAASAASWRLEFESVIAARRCWITDEIDETAAG